MPCRALMTDEARRAMYVDFEGRKEQPPVLLGMVAGDERAERLRQVVLEPRFTPAAERWGLDLMPVAKIVEEVVRRAEQEDRLLVGWSHHEERIVRALCPEELADRFAARYMSAIETARRWRRRTYPQAGRLPDGNRLAAYLKLIGYRVPPAHGAGRTGDTLRILGEAFDQGRAWEDLPGRRKARWTNLLRHNEADILGLRELCLVATGAIVPEGAEAAPRTHGVEREPTPFRAASGTVALAAP
jgi:hypothetical protein